MTTHLRLVAVSVCLLGSMTTPSMAQMVSLKPCTTGNERKIVAADGTVYQLELEGRINEQRPGQGIRFLLEPSDPLCRAVVMALTRNQVLVEMNRSGQIYMRRPGHEWELQLDVADPQCRALSMAVTPDGSIVEMNRGGQIYMRRPGQEWEILLDTSDPLCRAVQLMVSSDGVILERNRGNQWYCRQPGGEWQPVENCPVFSPSEFDSPDQTPPPPLPVKEAKDYLFWESEDKDEGRWGRAFVSNKYLRNKSERTIVATVRAHRTDSTYGRTDVVKEYTILPGERKYVGESESQNSTTYTITSASYK